MTRFLLTIPASRVPDDYGQYWQRCPTRRGVNARAAAQLWRLMRNPGALLVDVRSQPLSRRFRQRNRAALAASLARRYLGLFAGQIDAGRAEAPCEPSSYQANHVLLSPPHGNEASSTSPTLRRKVPYRSRLVTISYDARGPRLPSHHPTPAAAMGAVSLHYGTPRSDQMGHFRGERYLLHLARFHCIHACRTSPVERIDTHGK